MMAAILNSAMLDSDTAILHKTLCHLLLDSLKNPLHPLWLWLKLILSDSTWWWQPSWILQCWIQPFCTKLWIKLVQSDSNSFYVWLNSLMAAILNSAMLDSDTAILDWDTLLSSLRFTQKHSSSLWTWLKLVQSDWLNDGNHSSILPSSTLPSWIEPFCTKHWLKLVESDSNSFILTKLDDISHLELCHLGFKHLVIFSQIQSKTLFLHCDPDSN